jgi:hypothetical protein
MALKPPSKADETAFEAFWKAYPPRRPNPKVEARKAFAVQLAKGADPKDLVRAAEGYAIECRREKIEPAFVAHARTFLRQERWRDYLDDAAAEPAKRRHPELMARLCPPLSEADFVAWIEPLEIVHVPGRVQLGCRNGFVCDRIKANYLGLLERVFHRPVELVVVAE